MTTRAISRIALLTALCCACNGRSSPGESTPSPAATQEQQSGADRAFPPPETYADALDAPSRDSWQRPGHVVELLDCPPGSTVVDLGAGTGYFLPYLSEAVGQEGQVLALDTDRSMVEALKARVAHKGFDNVKPVAVPFDDPTLEESSVDRVLVVNVWHHIEERKRYARKLWTAVRPGGLVLIVDFDMDSPIGPPRSKRLKADTVMTELRTAGFDAQLLDETLPHQYAIAGRRP